MQTTSEYRKTAEDFLARHNVKFKFRVDRPV